MGKILVPTIITKIVYPLVPMFPFLYLGVTSVTKDQMVIMLSFHLSTEGVLRVYFVKVGNKNIR